MEDIRNKAADLAGHAEDLADTYYRLALLNVTQKAATITSTAITMILLCTAGTFVLLFGGFAFSWWLGDLLKSRAGGFLIGAGFFLLIMIIVVLFRKKIIFPFIRNLIIRKVYD
jgi:hypothetical protein